MRAELLGPGGAKPRAGLTDVPRLKAPTRSWSRPDWFEMLVLLAFAAVSAWVLVLDLWQVVAHGRVWTGTDGFYVVDQMQYLAWIRAAAHHLLASNLFVLRPTPADYFQPAVAISGGLAALGVAPWLALLLWKPVAVAAAFFGVRAYAHRSLERTRDRRIALVLGLFFGSVTFMYGSVGVLGDLLPAFLSWGYTFGLLAIGVMLFAVTAYARARTSERYARDGRIAWAPGLLGALAGVLHPWQGEILILIVIGAEVVVWRQRRRRPSLGLPLLTIIATGIPLLYYLILGRADLSWRMARVASKHSFSIWTILLALLPLVLPALLVYFRRPRSYMAVMTRVWPVAAVAVYLLSASTLSATPLHAFGGITVPLSILAIQGVRRVGARSSLLRHARIGPPVRGILVAFAVAAATIPGMVLVLRYAESVVAPTPGNANFIAHDERAALRYLARDREPGGVLTRFYLGTVVPAETGRRTFVGDCLWSEPNCNARAQITQMIFGGSLPAPTARWLIQQTGARFVLADCTSHANLTGVLRPMTESVHRFGCATVYTLRPLAPPRGDFA